MYKLRVLQSLGAKWKLILKPIATNRNKNAEKMRARMNLFGYSPRTQLKMRGNKSCCPENGYYLFGCRAFTFEEMPICMRHSQAVFVSNYCGCASRRMFVAAFMSFLACTSACLAEFLSKPIETNVAIESSGGSIAEGMGAG